jgi:hypothetical protein
LACGEGPAYRYSFLPRFSASCSCKWTGCVCQHAAGGPLAQQRKLCWASNVLGAPHAPAAAAWCARRSGRSCPGSGAQSRHRRAHTAAQEQEGSSSRRRRRESPSARRCARALVQMLAACSSAAAGAHQLVVNGVADAASCHCRILDSICMLHEADSVAPWDDLHGLRTGTPNATSSGVVECAASQHHPQAPGKAACQHHPQAPTSRNSSAMSLQALFSLFKARHYKLRQ